MYNSLVFPKNEFSLINFFFFGFNKTGKIGCACSIYGRDEKYIYIYNFNRKN